MQHSLEELHGQGPEEECLANVGRLPLDLHLVVGVELQLHNAGQGLSPSCRLPSPREIEKEYRVGAGAKIRTEGKPEPKVNNIGSAILDWLQLFNRHHRC